MMEDIDHMIQQSERYSCYRNGFDRKLITMNAALPINVTALVGFDERKFYLNYIASFKN